MMKRRNKRYAPSFWHSRLISIMSVSMVLFLVGAVASLLLLGKDLRDLVREKMSFTVILDQDIQQPEISQLQKSLQEVHFVTEVTYHSKEEALAELTEELGESPEEFLGWNPLLPSFDVKVQSNYTASQDSLTIVEHTLHRLIPQAEIRYRKLLLSTLNRNINIASVIALGIAFLLLLISLVLISNTVRLLIYSKRFSIYTMSLVGATPHFIRKPFILYNIVNGFYAAVIATLLLSGVAYLLTNHYPLFASLLSYKFALIVVAVIFISAFIITWISATLAVNKYLRMDFHKLYLA